MAALSFIEEMPLRSLLVLMMTLMAAFPTAQARSNPPPAISPYSPRLLSVDSPLRLWLADADEVVEVDAAELEAAMQDVNTEDDATGLASQVIEQAERISNVLEGPHWTFAYFSMMWMVSDAMRAHNMTGGTWSLLVNMLYGLSIIGVPASFVIPYLTADKSEFTGGGSNRITAQMYLLDFKKTSALTGALRREPEGHGLGWDFGWDGASSYGFIHGLNLTYQQTKVTSNEWVAVRNMFLKLDAFLGWDIATVLGGLLDVAWLKRQEINVRAGPSFFHNWIYMGDKGSAINAGSDKRIGHGAGLVTGFGYEVAGVVGVDFGLFGGLSASYHRGWYPMISFPNINQDAAALAALVSFDDLREAGGTYIWERTRVELDIPFTGYARSGTLNIAGSLTRYANDKGSSVNNRGFSVGSRWKF